MYTPRAYRGVRSWRPASPSTGTAPRPPRIVPAPSSSQWSSRVWANAVPTCRTSSPRAPAQDRIAAAEVACPDRVRSTPAPLSPSARLDRRHRQPGEVALRGEPPPRPRNGRTTGTPIRERETVGAASIHVKPDHGHPAMRRVVASMDGDPRGDLDTHRTSAKLRPRPRYQSRNLTPTSPTQRGKRGVGRGPGKR